jgi:hypothetical protein
MERRPRAHLVNVLEDGAIRCTDNFIYNPLVRVEIKGEAGITRGKVWTSSGHLHRHGPKLTISQ